jgi:5,10-methylenetetrahydrofolate reductase
VQITYAPHRLVEWRRSLDYNGGVYVGVLVLASARMARRVNATIPDIRVPERITDKLESDPAYGLDFALEQIETIRDSGAFDGVHLVPVTRFRQVAEKLQSLGAK